MDSEDQSAYWFLKGEMQSRAPLNEMDLEQILEMLQNVPTKEMNEAMEQAEMFGDEAAMIVLVMADNKRKFREEYASEYVLLGTMQSTPADGYNGYMKMMRDARKLVEIGNETGLDQKLGEAYQDESGRWFLPILERKASEDYDPDEETTEETVARTTAYFAALKDKNPDLARKIEFSVKNYDNLPRKEIEDAGFDYQVIDEWVDYVGMEDENLVEYDQCSDCEGEGIIITKYYPATRYDPADADFEKCEMCFGSGEIDPADYMDKDGNYMAESFNAEDAEEKEELLKSIMVDFANEIVYEPHFGFTHKDWLRGWNYAYEDGPRLNNKTMMITDVEFYPSTHRGMRDTLYFDIFNMKIASDIDYTVEYEYDREGYGNPVDKLDSSSQRKIQKIVSMLRKEFKRPDLEIREVGHDDDKATIQFEISLRSKALKDLLGAETWQGKSLAGSLDEMDEMLDRKKAESINPYFLGAGIFALTLGLLSRKR